MSLRGLSHPFFTLVVLLWTALVACAQSVRWSPNGGSLALRRANEIQLVFENCTPKEDPRVPVVDGLQMTSAGRSDNTQIINGKITRSVILGFAVRPTEEKTFVIPEFTVKTSEGELRVPATTFGVAGPANPRADGSVALEDVAHARFDLPQEVYAGEVFALRYQQTTIRRYFSQYGSELRWDPSPLTVEDWQAPTTTEALLRGERNLVLSLETRALAPTPGDLTLKPGEQMINLITGNNGGFFFSSNVEQFAIPSQPGFLRVKPLPAGAPASFHGAVGQFKLASKAVPAQGRVGEPVTWTLTLSGTGNWPALQSLPAREVSSTFRAVQAEPKRTLQTGKLFDGSLDEDVVLIPQEPGTYSFGPYTYTYFDPATGQYVTLSTPVHTVTVLAANANLAATGGAGAGAQESTVKSQAPGLPAPVPGEALDAKVGARAPLTRGAWLAWCLLPGAGLLIAWCTLAIRRALSLDAQTPLRRARAAVLVHLRDLATATDPAARRRLLFEWQKAVAQEHGLARAYPSAQAFVEEAALRQLWSEVEAHLFGTGVELPADWVTRAVAQAQARPGHPFTKRLLLRGSMWLPAVLLLAAMAGAPALQAEDGRAAYQRGDYLAAEAAWRTALDREPTHAALHYNLSLALAQQGNWSEATAHACLAFLQDPAEPATQRQLRYLLKKPGFTPQVLPDLLTDQPGAEWIRSYSVRGWQNLTVLALALLALAAGLGLWRRFGNPWRALPVLAWLALGLGALLLPLSLYGYFGYKTARLPNAQLVWRETGLYSVPTAADAEQQKSTVAAGTLATAERVFLTWTQVKFADGQLGWVQTADLLPIWEAKK